MPFVYVSTIEGEGYRPKIVSRTLPGLPMKYCPPGLHQGFHAREAKATPWRIGIFLTVQPDETLENGLLLSLGNPRPVILDRDEQIHVATNGHFCTLPSVLHCVAYQVPKDVPNLPGIVAERGVAEFPGDLDENAVGFKKLAEPFNILFPAELFRRTLRLHFEHLKN